MVDFKSVVIEQAEVLLHELAQLPPSHKLVTENKSYFQKIMYFRYNLEAKFFHGKKIKEITRQL